MVYVVERYLPGLPADLPPRRSRLAPVIEESDLPFDRIVPAVLVQPTKRSGEMSISTSIPKTAGRRRSHPLSAIAAIAAVIALAAWAIATYAVDTTTPSVRSSAPTQASVWRRLTPAEREYVLGIMSMTPAEARAAFGSGPMPSVRHGGTVSTTPSSAAMSVASPILPACDGGPCWHVAPGARRPARNVR